MHRWTKFQSRVEVRLPRPGAQRNPSREHPASRSLSPPFPAPAATKTAHVKMRAWDQPQENCTREWHEPDVDPRGVLTRMFSRKTGSAIGEEGFLCVRRQACCCPKHNFRQLQCIYGSSTPELARPASTAGLRAHDVGRVAELLSLTRLEKVSKDPKFRSSLLQNSVCQGTSGHGTSIRIDRVVRVCPIEQKTSMSKIPSVN